MATVTSHTDMKKNKYIFRGFSQLLINTMNIFKNINTQIHTEHMMVSQREPYPSNKCLSDEVKAGLPLWTKGIRSKFGMLMQYNSKSNDFKCLFSFDCFTPVLATVAVMVRMWKTNLIEEDDVCEKQKGRRKPKKWKRGTRHIQFSKFTCKMCSAVFCPRRFMRMQFPGSLPGQMCSHMCRYYFIYLYLVLCALSSPKTKV